MSGNRGSMHQNSTLCTKSVSILVRSGDWWVEMWFGRLGCYGL